MIAEIEQSIMAQLRNCSLLRTVRAEPAGLAEAREMGKAQAMARLPPPWAVLSLAEDRLVREQALTKRELHWNLRLGFSCLDANQAGGDILQTVEALRRLLAGWRPVGGEELQVRVATCHGSRNNVIIWSFYLVLDMYEEACDTAWC